MSKRNFYLETEGVLFFNQHPKEILWEEKNCPYSGKVFAISLFFFPLNYKHKVNRQCQGELGTRKGKPA